MDRRFTFIATLTLLALAVPSTSLAALFIEQEHLSFAEDVATDLYAVGEAVALPEGVTVAGDAAVAGGILKFSGSILGDVFTAGQDVTIDGAIENDMYVLGNTVSLAGTVGDDVHAAGSTVTISTATIDDLFAAGESVKVAEVVTVRGDSYLAGGAVTVDGIVEGDLRIAGEQVVISDSAVVNGNLTTYGKNEPHIADGATITGETKHQAYEFDDSAKSFQRQLLGWLGAVVSLFVTAWLLHWLLPGFTNQTRTVILAKPAQSFGLGVLWAILALPVVIVLFFTLIGWHLALALLALTFLAVLLAGAIMSLYVGSWVIEKLARKTVQALTWQHILLGAVVVKTLVLIPLIGWLVFMVLLAASFGGTILTLWSLARGKKE